MRAFCTLSVFFINIKYILLSFFYIKTPSSRFQSLRNKTKCDSHKPGADPPSPSLMHTWAIGYMP